MTTWITDNNGNRASAEYFGSEEKARAALATLENCHNCTNCRDCRDCTNCRACRDCRNCRDCSDCRDCHGCRDCRDCRDCTFVIKAEKPRVVGPFRSDRYQFVLNGDGGVRAGCRVFATMAEAREHWTRTRGGTPLGDETMAILDALEALDAIRKGPKQ